MIHVPEPVYTLRFVFIIECLCFFCSSCIVCVYTISAMTLIFAFYYMVLFLLRISNICVAQIFHKIGTPPHSSPFSKPKRFRFNFIFSALFSIVTENEVFHSLPQVQRLSCYEECGKIRTV